MILRMLPLTALALALVVSARAQAANDADVSTQDGKVVSVTSEKLVMTDKDGKEQTLTVAPDAKVTCDGSVSKLDELKPNMRIRVTTKKDDPRSATRIEALDKNEDFKKRDK